MMTSSKAILEILQLTIFFEYVSIVHQCARTTHQNFAAKITRSCKCVIRRAIDIMDNGKALRRKLPVKKAAVLEKKVQRFLGK